MAVQEPDDRPARTRARRLSVPHFLAALLLLFVVLPFVDELPDGDLIEAVLMTLVLLAAVPAVGGGWRTLLAGAVLVSPAVLATWVDHFRPGAVPRSVAEVGAIVFVSFVVVNLLGYVVRAPRVNAEVMCAAVAVYLMLALIWTFAYTLVGRLVPDSFAFTIKSAPPRPMARFEALYFSVSTLTTADYGDIVPVSNAARMLAMMEALTGVLYLALLISRLVSLYTGDQPPPDAARSAREP
jgi:hypothetical protein